ncbi:MarR family transcriptional regulator [Nonomuraea sediminis]|uniref:MarR family transcriptional regulator n=1 Tax=Nonomuraea sediminis TaxID=2835864 RepID=UPI001BDD8B4E|nr:MarR family transcriptional regulator [Nonomuraea sediminis]
MDIREQLGLEVQASQSAVDAYDEAAAQYLGVNRTDLRCIEVLLEHQEITPSQLGVALGLTTGSVTAMLDRLEKLGYLTRSPDPGDRRKVIVRATEEARAKGWELYGPIVEDGASIPASYTDEQVELLLDFTRRSRELYERQIAKLRERIGEKRPRKR